MQYEKEIKRPDGSKIKIAVSLFVDFSMSACNIAVYKCPPRKRTWTDTAANYQYSQQNLTPEQKNKLRLRDYLEHASVEEINAAILEAWEKTKPGLLQP